MDICQISADYSYRSNRWDFIFAQENIKNKKNFSLTERLKARDYLNEEIATASEDVWIYFVDGDEIHRKQEYLALTSENIFSAWKIKNGIGDEVKLIKVKIDSNSTTNTFEYGGEGMVEHKIGDYFVYNITVSANIEAYYETIDSKLLLESLKQTMTGYSAIEYDEYHITFE